jgi:hypothetical protein
MNRLKALLHAQHEGATTQRNAQHGDVLHVANPRECNTQQPLESADLAEARRLYHAFAKRHGFTDEERDADEGLILDNPVAWIAQFRREGVEDPLQTATTATTTTDPPL